MEQRAVQRRSQTGGTSRPARATPAPTAETRMLGLQRLAGNRAVAGMLMRQEDEGPLTATEVASAISFYRSQPKQYTEEIIRQIQGAVGVEENGTVDAAFVQAVARWQQSQGASHPALKVDGKAGPRTLPRMFAAGLNRAGEGEAFGTAAQTAVIDRWPELTPRERAVELVRLVNERLADAGVPAVTPNPSDTGNNAGQFDFETWTMDIGLEALEPEVVDRDAAADLVDTIYHEARHAEQWFRMAQLRASQGHSARRIAREMTIPLRIAQAAFDDPLQKGSMQALIARGWNESVYGSRSAHRNRVLTELDAAATALTKAREAFEADPSEANQRALDRAIERDRRATEAYLNLPEENDAWATGPMVQPGITRGSPVPEPEPVP